MSSSRGPAASSSTAPQQGLELPNWVEGSSRNDANSNSTGEDATNEQNTESLNPATKVPGSTATGAVPTADVDREIENRPTVAHGETSTGQELQPTQSRIEQRKKEGKHFEHDQRSEAQSSSTQRHSQNSQIEFPSPDSSNGRN